MLWSKGYLLEVKLCSSDDFLKTAETLTRIGTVSEPWVLRQVCYILHKQGKYFILHEDELVAMDAMDGGVIPTEHSIRLRNRIAVLLEEWNLITVPDKPSPDEQAKMADIKVVSFREKSKWELFSPYKIGKPKRNLL